MSNTTIVKQPLSPAQILERFQEQEKKVHRTIIRDALNGNAEFQGMLASEQKSKRYLSEAETLLTDEGFAKQRQRLEDRIAATKKQIESLDAKRKVAEDSVTTLKSNLEKHESSKAILAKALVSFLDAGHDPSNKEALMAAISETLKNVDIKSLSEATDPFAAFRATKEPETTEETPAA